MFYRLQGKDSISGNCYDENGYKNQNQGIQYTSVMGWKTLKDAINKGIVWENGRADGFCRFSRYARKTPAFVET